MKDESNKTFNSGTDVGILMKSSDMTIIMLDL